MSKRAQRLPMNISRKFILSNETPFSIREAYKVARTNLVFSLAAKENKIVVVTSCSPAEGKSTNCLNLAITMAEMGASVLVIDADMRKPVQHTLLRLDNRTGLSSVLGGIVHNVSKVIHKNVRINLDVLTAGSIPPNPAELLSGEKMDELLSLVSSHYDYVFIDTPPANVVTDAFLFNGKTAGLIFVVREGSTTHPEIKEAIEKAKMTNGKILGFVKAYCSPKGVGRYGSYKYKYKYNYENKGG